MVFMKIDECTRCGMALPSVEDRVDCLPICPDCQQAGVGNDPTEKSDPFPPDEKPSGELGMEYQGGLTKLGPLNYYLICDHYAVVARWQNDSRGWMLGRKDGFVRVSHVVDEIPWFGEFVLIEVGIQRQKSGVRLSHVRSFRLQEEFALPELYKSDSAILRMITGEATLSEQQKELVRDFVKSEYLRHVWITIDDLL